MHIITALATFVSFLYNVSTITGQCLSTMHLDAMSGITRTLTSPKYPSEYSPDSNCNWVINAPSNQDRVLLTFHDVLLESSCDYDGLVIKDGDEYSDVISEICGSYNPGVITSRGRSIHIQLYSDGSVQDRGFSLSYTSFPVGSNCPDGWVQRNNNCYILNTNSTYRDDAHKHCAYNASNLASITSSEENDFLSVSFTGLSAWIGLQYNSDYRNYSWVDRNAFHYTNWQAGHPVDTMECTKLDVFNGFWATESCQIDRPYICKKNVAGTTVVYKISYPGTENGGDGFNFWEIPGIIIAVIVFGSVGYVLLRSFCRAFCEFCDDCCDCVRDGCRHCSDCCCEVLGCVLSCAICKRVSNTSTRTRHQQQDIEIEIGEVVSNSHRTRSVSLIEIDVAAQDSRRHSWSTASDNSTIISSQPRLQPSAPPLLYDPSAPPPSYGNLTFRGFHDTVRPIDVPLSLDQPAGPPPEYPPPSYDDVTTSTA
ncbi:uncharacterized protein LOC144437204 isoform X1 [Glandiceps talaboti]